MAKNFRRIFNGLQLVGQSSISPSLVGEMRYNSSTDKLQLYDGTLRNIVTDTGTQTLTNKTLTSPAINSPTGLVKADVGLSNVDNTSDVTKNAAAVTLTNKTISGSSNTLSSIGYSSLVLTNSIVDADISSSAAIARSKIATGTAYGVVSNASDGSLTSIAPGTSGKVLTSDGTQWNSATPAATLDAPNFALNYAIASSVGSNILTISLKDSTGADPSSGSPVKVGFRDFTAATGIYHQRTVTAALSQTLTQYTTLGEISGQSNNLWIYLMDTDGSGTMKLGMCGILLDENTLQSTVAESFTGTVTIAAPGVWTALGHGMTNNTKVRLSTTGALPTGLTANTTDYYVVSKTSNTFQLSATPGGTGITTTGSQSGVHTIHIADCAVLVSNTAYTNISVRVIGRALSNQTTSGTWAAIPTELSTVGPFKEDIVLMYKDSGALNISQSTLTVKAYATLESATHGLFNNSNYYFVWSGPATRFQFTGCLFFNTASWAEDDQINMEVDKNGLGTTVGFIQHRIQRTATQYPGTVSITKTLLLQPGDFVNFAYSQASSGARALYADGSYNYMSIVKV